jgi:hypothetical protein
MSSPSKKETRANRGDSRGVSVMPNPVSLNQGKKQGMTIHQSTEKRVTPARAAYLLCLDDFSYNPFVWTILERAKFSSYCIQMTYGRYPPRGGVPPRTLCQNPMPEPYERHKPQPGPSPCGCHPPCSRTYPRPLLRPLVPGPATVRSCLPLRSCSCAPGPTRTSAPTSSR